VGGPGLIVLGIIDNSAIPVPGSVDAMTIVLAASQKSSWLYYALMGKAIRRKFRIREMSTQSHTIG
jgi:hypothetical protein